MTVGNNRRSIGTHPGLILHRLALIPVVIRRLPCRVGGTIGLRRHGRELAGKLLRNVRIKGCDRGIHGTTARGDRSMVMVRLLRLLLLLMRSIIRIIRIIIIVVGDGGSIIVLHRKLREPWGSDIRSKLVGRRSIMMRFTGGI